MGVIRIALRGKYGVGRFVLINEEDCHLIEGRSWRCYPSGHAFYAVTDANINGKWTTIRMHNLILPPPPGLVVDHQNGDGLNNTRENLRHADKHQNKANGRKRINNPAKYKGIVRKGYFWFAKVRYKGKTYDAGHYRTQYEAAHAYNEMAQRVHGEFARLNVLPPRPDADDIPLEPPPDSSQYHGVLFDKGRRRCWKAIAPARGGAPPYIGRFHAEIEAAKARDAYCVEHGYDVPLNFP